MSTQEQNVANEKIAGIKFDALGAVLERSNGDITFREDSIFNSARGSEAVNKGNDTNRTANKNLFEVYPH